MNDLEAEIETLMNQLDQEIFRSGKNIETLEIQIDIAITDYDVACDCLDKITDSYKTLL